MVILTTTTKKNHKIGSGHVDPSTYNHNDLWLKIRSQLHLYVVDHLYVNDEKEEQTDEQQTVL